MKKVLLYLTAICLFISSLTFADSFGTGANQFEIDFVLISGATNPTVGISTGRDFIFTGVDHDYRIGTYETTNDQWNKFKVEYGTVTGNPSSAYDTNAYWTGTNLPTNMISWREAAQFVNWLNTSTGHQAAYKFTGTIHTSDYTFAAWDETDIGYDASNPYRNSNAYYFLPSENEWVKAAYWNGNTLQEYATKAGESIFQGDGVSGTGWNYYNGSYATNPYGPWAVGSGSQELNGTYDMMGNVWELTESPWYSGSYNLGGSLTKRGAGYEAGYGIGELSVSRQMTYSSTELYDMGFRVASVIPEPATLLLLGVGAVMIRKRKS